MSEGNNEYLAEKRRLQEEAERAQQLKSEEGYRAEFGPKIEAAEKAAEEKDTETMTAVLQEMNIDPALPMSHEQMAEAQRRFEEKLKQ